MGAEYIAGMGSLTLGQAVHLAQNSPAGVDQRLAQHLERKLAEVHAKIKAQPNTYILPQDEFALINYYRSRFGDSDIIKTVALGEGKQRSLGWEGKRACQHRAAMPFMSFLLILMALSHPILASLALSQPHLHRVGPALAGRSPNETAPLLKCLQVSPPVLSPKTSCEQTLMVHEFAYSYGVPFVGSYTPPECDFNRVTINFTVTSAGRQFDRLALMYLNDTEVWRTSTAEPTQSGIIWSYVKDMSNYVSLLKEPQKIIFDLGNIVDDTYTGKWQTTLTATFFTAEDTIDAADVIVPISARQSSLDKPSAFVVPESKAIDTFALPKNVKKAVVSISAVGQATEEFWWANVLSSDTTVFGSETTLYGYSPFRELQLYIDGTLAGVAWPFPVIFTGGVVPGFWRPVVGIDAFDLQENEIDISAFLPSLCDGEEHSFEIKIAGINDDGAGNADLSDTVGSNWVVTGKVFLWLDAAGRTTQGTAPTITAPEAVLGVSSSVTKAANGSDQALKYSVKASRSFSVSSTITTSEGSRDVTWVQNLNFAIEGTLSNSGNDQITSQTTRGQIESLGGYSRTFTYPLQVSSSYNVLEGGNFTIDATMSRAKSVQKFGHLAFPTEADIFDYSLLPDYPSSFAGAQISNSQNGSARYLGAPALKKSFGSGSTEEIYSLAGLAGPGASGKSLYRRHILAANDSVVYDSESIGDDTSVTQKDPPSLQKSGQQTYAKVGIKAMLGRGPLQQN
ncbi:hypothetical protein BU23DRAFT_593906 [Bimuria novae-zelandiae CBS 107.79]|uniref:Peptide N-acetyl-beta-D-glucosaminyl asparaginase amidase A N-terminal domain-containing protein n=1 Tax=Bimuria novae-zelandiae CBS 107.79 TaxID=1447943 RepID=A0A6A5UJY5_9PLEO|nr:hypothetical protein BU23DRAFT_593906 [Bimuria novae-zelandiae CBS 107.79]